MSTPEKSDADGLELTAEFESAIQAYDEDRARRQVDVLRGREASLVSQTVGTLCDELYRECLTRGQMAYQAGKMDGTRALLAWSELTAVQNLQAKLRERITKGETAAKALEE